MQSGGGGGEAWLRVSDERVWILVRIIHSDSAQITFTSEDGQTHTFPASQLNLCARNPQNLRDVDNLVSAPYADEANVVEAVELRYGRKNIYTFSGPVLIAVNPWSPLSIYGDDVQQAIDSEVRSRQDAMPHIYTIAAKSFSLMQRTGKRQSILISGESGAGKTESTKFVMNYLASACGTSAAKETAQQVLQSNPILEAFGNAKTLRNDNSSRFGKYIDMMIDHSTGAMSGCAIRTYLLERLRVTRVAPGERGFHIFYQLTQSRDSPLASECQLLPSTSFACLNPKHSVAGTAADAAAFSQTVRAFTLTGISETQQMQIFKIVSGILHLSNLEFIDNSGGDNGCEPRHPQIDVLQSLLGINIDALTKAFCFKKISAGGDNIDVPQNASAATTARDAMSQALYCNLFDHLVSKLNGTLLTSVLKTSIAVLDLFGFESFQTNRFEQLCINYANERLQQHFNQHNFKAEQELYASEGIVLSESDFVDNSSTLSALEHPLTGVLGTLEEECRMPKGSDKGFHERLTNAVSQTKTDKVSTSTKVSLGFSVAHYAALVTYTAEGILSSSRTHIPTLVTAAAQGSLMPLVKQLFEDKSSQADSNSTRARRGSQVVGDSISSKFRKQLVELMKSIEATNPSFVRCVNPNASKQAWTINREYLLNQLRCGGVMEAIRMGRQRFGIRLLQSDLLQKYRLIFPVQLMHAPSPAGLHAYMSQTLGLPANSFIMGKTRVFMTNAVESYFEQLLAQVVGGRLVVLQRAFRSALARRTLRKLHATLTIARYIKRTPRRMQYSIMIQGERQRIINEASKATPLVSAETMQASTPMQNQAVPHSHSQMVSVHSGQNFPPQGATFYDDDVNLPPGAQFTDHCQHPTGFSHPTQVPTDNTFGHTSNIPQGNISGVNSVEDDEQLHDTSPLCIRVQIHASDGSVLSTLIFYVDNLANSVKRNVPAEDRKSFFRVMYSTIQAKDVMTYLRKEVQARFMDPALPLTPEARMNDKLIASIAELLAYKLLDVGVYRVVQGPSITVFDDESALLRFHSDEKGTNLLNCKQIWYRQSRNAVIVTCELMRKLLSMAICSPSLSSTEEWREWVESTGELQLVNIVSLTREEIISVFLNAFNMMMIHGHIERKHEDGISFKERRSSFFKQVKYMISAFNYSLEEIQSRLLCRNSKSKGPRARGSSALRRAPEPRILFALSLGLMSSPRLRIYHPETLDEELNRAAAEVCNMTEVHSQTREIKLHKVFDWFKEDFGKAKNEILRFVCLHCKEPLRTNIAAMATNSSMRLTYQSYDWRVSLRSIQQYAPTAVQYSLKQQDAVLARIAAAARGPVSTNQTIATPLVVRTDAESDPASASPVVVEGLDSGISQPAGLPSTPESSKTRLPAHHHNPQTHQHLFGYTNNSMQAFQGVQQNVAVARAPPNRHNVHVAAPSSSPALNSEHETQAFFQQNGAVHTAHSQHQSTYQGSQDSQPTLSTSEPRMLATVSQQPNGFSSSTRSSFQGQDQQSQQQQLEQLLFQQQSEPPQQTQALSNTHIEQPVQMATQSPNDQILHGQLSRSKNSQGHSAYGERYPQEQRNTVGVSNIQHVAQRQNQRMQSSNFDGRASEHGSSTDDVYMSQHLNSNTERIPSGSQLRGDPNAQRIFSEENGKETNKTATEQQFQPKAWQAHRVQQIPESSNHSVHAGRPKSFQSEGSIGQNSSSQAWQPVHATNMKTTSHYSTESSLHPHGVHESTVSAWHPVSMPTGQNHRNQAAHNRDSVQPTDSLNQQTVLSRGLAGLQDLQNQQDELLERLTKSLGEV